MMNEERQITFMQARICRMAARRWNRPLHDVMRIFAEHRVLYYIEECYGYFHLEGDEAVLDDVERYLKNRGVSTDAPAA